MRTHKQNLAHLRAELTKQGVLVVGVRKYKPTGQYRAHSVNLVNGGHIFVWLPGSPTVLVRRCEFDGREVSTGVLTIAN